MKLNYFLIIKIIFLLISICHLNLYIVASSFASNHSHFNEFNDHEDIFNEIIEVSLNHSHKHRHQNQDTEHEHSHLLSLEHKDILFSEHNTFICQNKKIFSNIPNLINNLKISVHIVEVFRPPIHLI